MKQKLSQKIRGLLLALAGFLCTVSIQAQTWSAPSFKGSVPSTGTTYYLYNIGSNGFLTRGGYWNTESVVASLPRANASTNIVKWTMTNTSGSLWTFQYNLAGSNVSNNYLFAANASSSDGSVFTDNSTNNTWTVASTDGINNIYSIQIVSTYGGYVATQFLGSDLNPEVANATTKTGNTGTFNTVRYNRTSSSYTQWKFVSQSDYDLYQAKVLLDRYMRYARVLGGIDLTSYVTTYNSDVTADITTAATTLLSSLNRVDATSLVVNPSFENTTALYGWTNSGTYARQSNTPGQGWTKDLTYYAEKYVGSSYGSNGNGTKGYLGAGTITQTVLVPNGLYGVQVSAHAIQQAGANPLHTGAFIVAGSKSTEVGPGQDYFIDSVSVTNGSLTLGYSLTGTIQVNWTGFDNFRLYRYVTYPTPSLSANVSSLRYDNLNNSSTFTVSGTNLSNNVTITAPAGITVTPSTLSANPTAETVTVTYDGTSVVDGVITLTSGSTSTTVAVKASSNSSCYTPAYSTGNMIADPTFSAASLSAGGFTSWGAAAIKTENPYCGRGSAFVIGSCWPNGGSIDRSLSTSNGNALKPNTVYRLRAMYNSKASSGTYFQIQVEGYNGSSSLSFQLPNSNGWAQFDQTFTTGSTVTQHGVYFNSCSASTPALADTCYIDNYEMYPVPKTYASSSSLTFSGANVTQKIAVRASNLTSDIAITAPAGFSIDRASMLSTVSGSSSDSLAITFNGPNSASGYVHFISGSVNDSILVTGTVAPTIVPNETSLRFDDLNTSGSFQVTGGNLVSDITITAPIGITVSPSTISAGSASNVTLTVTYDGTTSDVNGNITLTSGSATASVAVVATKNSDCISALYPSGNLIVDPYLNSLSTYAGWGAKSINTDLAYVYCGLKSGKITGVKAGSIDFDLNGVIQPNALYRVKAMIYSIGGKSQIGITRFTTASPSTLETVTTTTSSWEALDFTFTTGATLGSSPLMYFNNYLATGGSSVSYIDNWELYHLPSITVAESSVSSFASTVGSSDTKTITVSGNGFTSGVAIALSGANADQFSLSTSSLPLVADSVHTTQISITYTPTSASIEHVATLTLSSTGAADKVFNLTGSSTVTTGVASAKPNVFVVVKGRVLNVKGAESLEVYTAQGVRVVHKKSGNDNTSLSLQPGVYIVKTNIGVQKVTIQ